MTGEFAGIPSTLVLTPLLAPGELLPYYHPNVRRLAFRHVPSTPAILRIEAVVLPDTPTDLNSRLYRTSLALLETLHRYGWGALTNYQKRVKHDCMIPREEYQDLYLVMRERYKHLVGEWKEVTDPLKHVFEVSGSKAGTIFGGGWLIENTGYWDRDVFDASLEEIVWPWGIGWKSR
jgi:tRNASer (uridine44-2'-O)-methyltransferase